MSASHDAVHRDRFKYSKAAFLEYNLEPTLDAVGEISTDKLFANFTPVGSSEGELMPTAERLIATVKTAFSTLRAMKPVPRDIEEMRQFGIDVDDEERDVWEKVAQRVAPRMSSSQYIPTFVPSSDFPVRRQDVRIQREEELGTELRVLDSEIALLNTRIAAAGKPKGVLGAFLALSYLAAVGIVFPVILMALRPVPSGVFWRVLVVSAFVSGLGFILGYFIRERLLLSGTKRPRREQASRRTGAPRSTHHLHPDDEAKL